MSYVYLEGRLLEDGETVDINARSGTVVYAVGFFDPSGNFRYESDWDSPDSAAERVHYLNGGEPLPNTHWNIS